MLRLARQSDPLLRRPFSIHNLIISNGRAEGLELLYKVVGKGTAIMAGQNRGIGLIFSDPLEQGL